MGFEIVVYVVVFERERMLCPKPRTPYFNLAIKFRKFQMWLLSFVDIGNYPIWSSWFPGRDIMICMKCNTVFWFTCLKSWWYKYSASCWKDLFGFFWYLNYHGIYEIGKVRILALHEVPDSLGIFLQLRDLIFELHTTKHWSTFFRVLVKLVSEDQIAQVFV